MGRTAFADIVNQTIYFSDEFDWERVVLELIDTRWVQRLRDILQTGNTNLVYMFSEHSRFGHSLGVAWLANYLLDSLNRDGYDVSEYRCAVNAAALLHDIGHIAPGSHMAYKTWYPESPDCHEQLSTKIIQNDDQIQKVLSAYSADLPEIVCKILSEDPSLPKWTWQIISGGGWNVDRGNWCIVDSVMAGVSYGRYNVPALVESMLITKDGELAIRENRLDAMLHFAIARHSMYRQVYHHRVLLASEMVNRAIVQRVKDIECKLNFCDDNVKMVISSKTPLDLPLETVYNMRESWWRYHVLQWANSEDMILSDLCNRLLNRQLFKTIRLRDNNQDELIDKAKKAVREAGFDPRYYFHIVSTQDVHSGDLKHRIRVMLDNGDLKSLEECEPLWDVLARESSREERKWIVLPKEAKEKVGVAR